MRNSDKLQGWFKDSCKVPTGMVVAVGVHDLISAVVAAAVISEMQKRNPDFRAVLQISGFGVAAASYMLPDTGDIGLDRLLNQTNEICSAVRKRYPGVPVMADLDHGYGRPVIAVRYAIKYGVAGFNLEDQVYYAKDIEDVAPLIESKFGPLSDVSFFRKSCGHVGSKEILIPGRIGGGKVVRKKEDMVRDVERVSLMAVNDMASMYGRVAANIRTDIFSTYPLNMGKEALEDAVDRGNAYLNAGAACIFYEAVPEFDGISQKKAIEYLIEKTNGPTSFNALRGGRTKDPLLASDLDKMGASRMSIPISSIGVYIQAMTSMYAQMLAQGTNANIQAAGFPAVKDFLGWGDALRDMATKPQEVAKQGSKAAMDSLIESIEGAFEEYVEGVVDSF